MNPKNRYQIEIFASGDALENITKLVSLFNEGKIEFTLEELQTFLKMRSFLFMFLPNSELVFIDDNTANIMEKGKALMKITKEEVFELQES